MVYFKKVINQSSSSYSSMTGDIPVYEVVICESGMIVCLAFALINPVNYPPLYSGLFNFNNFLNYLI